MIKVTVFGQRSDEKQPNVNICFTAPPALEDRIKQNAAECGVKVSAFLREAVESYMNDLDASMDAENPLLRRLGRF